MLALGILVGALLLYVAFVRWRIAQPHTIAYHRMVSPILRACAASDMAAITLWHTCYLLAPTVVLGPDGEVHERYHMTAQWDRWPYTFPVRYLWELIRHGYGCNQYEEAARKAAGEPSQCL